MLYAFKASLQDTSCPMKTGLKCILKGRAPTVSLLFYAAFCLDVCSTMTSLNVKISSGIQRNAEVAYSFVDSSLHSGGVAVFIANV